MSVTGNFKLSPIEASAYLKATHGIRCAVATLAKMRCLRSDGPEFIRAGRDILYSQDSLDAFATARKSQPLRSTSDLHHAQAA